MSTATLRAGAAQNPCGLAIGFPRCKGQFLTGRDAVLPQASSGQVALVAIGFTYRLVFRSKRGRIGTERRSARRRTSRSSRCR